MYTIRKILDLEPRTSALPIGKWCVQ